MDELSPSELAMNAPSTGEMDLEARANLRRVAGLGTELADVTEVEYRQLRLEKVVLIGVWSGGDYSIIERSMAELAQLAETAGSAVLMRLCNVETNLMPVHTSAQENLLSCAKLLWPPVLTP